MDESNQEAASTTTRRNMLLLPTTTLVASTLLGTGSSLAVQGYTPGRLPGLGAAGPDGWRTYLRPSGKMGGHGTGWSEIQQYSFDIGPNWLEVPVSIADLGGTEIDLRFQNPDVGDVAVVVAPVLRIREEFGFNANVTIEDIGDPEKVIKGFSLEIFGAPIDEEDILESNVLKGPGDLTYYKYRVRPNHLVSVTATKNRVFILLTNCSTRQWKKHEAEFRRIVDSFYVIPFKGMGGAA